MAPAPGRDQQRSGLPRCQMRGALNECMNECRRGDEPPQSGAPRPVFLLSRPGTLQAGSASMNSVHASGASSAGWNAVHLLGVAPACPQGQAQQGSGFSPLPPSVEQCLSLSHLTHEEGSFLGFPLQAMPTALLAASLAAPVPCCHWFHSPPHLLPMWIGTRALALQRDIVVALGCYDMTWRAFFTWVCVQGVPR